MYNLGVLQPEREPSSSKKQEREKGKGSDKTEESDDDDGDEDEEDDPEQILGPQQKRKRALASHFDASPDDRVRTSQRGERRLLQVLAQS